MLPIWTFSYEQTKKKSFSLSSSIPRLELRRQFLLLAGDLLELFNAADVVVVSCQMNMEQTKNEWSEKYGEFKFSIRICIHFLCFVVLFCYQISSLLIILWFRDLIVCRRNWINLHNLKMFSIRNFLSLRRKKKINFHVSFWDLCQSVSNERANKHQNECQQLDIM